MRTQQNHKIAHAFLEKIATGSSPESVAELFSEQLIWHIPGDESALPWIGKKHGKAAVIDFMTESNKRINRTHFSVHDILANDRRAVIYGELAATDLVTKQSLETPFVIILDITDDLIDSFLMMEDGVAVAKSAHIK